MTANNLNHVGIEAFGTEIRHIFVTELQELLLRFPFLEQPHKNSFHTIVFVEEGQGEILVDQDKIRIDCQKIAFIKPNQISSIDINRNAKGMFVCFTEDFFSLRYNNNILYQFQFLQQQARTFVRISDSQFHQLNILLHLMKNEFQIQKRESRKVLRSYVNIILFEIDRLYQPNASELVNNPKRDKIREFEILIDKHFSDKKLPSAYADLLFVSPSYLNKICKEETGQTAGDLIRKRIVIEAQRLLHYTRLSVNEIANKLGFENHSYFVTFFRKQVGVTPEKFRKNQS